VPVTAKLSRRFYETFGDEIANELVEWFNRVDDAYRSEFRELFEVHFSRFDAKLEQRTAELDARWERRFAELDAKWERRLGELDAKWEIRFAQLDARLERKASSLVKWMFGFWIGNFVATAGIVFGALSLLHR